MSDDVPLAALREAWVAAVAAADAEALRPLLTDDYEVWANGAPALSGADAAVSAMRQALEAYLVEQQFDPIETVVTEHWAFQRGIERMTITPRAGGETRTVQQRALLILRRDSDGRWRFARGMTNALPPAS